MTRKQLCALTILTSLLGACQSAPTGPVLTGQIAAKLSRICPAPLTKAQLQRAAAVVSKYKADAEVTGVVSDLDVLDQATRICARRR